MTQNVPPQDEAEQQERRRRPWFLLPWMVLVFLILFCCGQLALLTNLQGAGGDTRSQMRADYSPWAFMPMAPLDPRLLLQAMEDLGWDGLPPIGTAVGCLLPGQDCDGTPTPTGTWMTPTADPGVTGTPGPGTGTPTVTPTLDLATNTPTNEPPTYTPTVTNTPTQTPTPTPLVHPLKWGSPRDLQPGVSTPVDFTILIINGRSGPATLTRVTDCLPAGMSFVSASRPPTSISSLGGCDAGETEIVWDLSPAILLPPGRFYRIQMVTTADTPAAGDVLENFVMAEGDFTASSYWTSVYAWTPTPTPVDVTPTAVPDNATTNEDVPVTIPVLANDSGLTNPPLTLLTTDPPCNPTPLLPSNGSIVINPGNNTITYTPFANWYGQDRFEYCIRDVDGDVSNVATVTIDVAAVNDVPVAVPDGPYSVSEDPGGPLVVGALAGMLANDTDVDLPPQVLTAALDVGPLHASLGGFTLNPDGSFAYMPTVDYRGPDSFTYHANDGLANSNVVTVTLSVTPVNDIPVASADSGTTPEDTAVSIPVLANDSGLGDTPLVLSIVTPPSNGVAAFVGTSVQYTPNADFRGSDSFVYRVQDTAFGAPEITESSTATVWVTVTPVNDVPVASADSTNTLEDTAVLVPVLANDVLGNNPALGDYSVAVSVETAPTNGSVLVVGTSIQYTPDPNYYGSDSFVYRLTESPQAPEVQDSRTATVTVTVTPVNDVPIANADSGTAAEDALWPGLTIDVVANDSDVEGAQAGFVPQVNPATVVLVAAPLNGVATNNGDGTISYLPDLDFRGTDSFTYTVQDYNVPPATSNVAVVTVTVTPVNDVPSAVNDNRTTAEDTAITINVLTNDDLGDDPLVGDQPVRVSISTPPVNGGAVVNGDNSVTYTPNLNWNGTDSFTYVVRDAQGPPFYPPEVSDTSNTATVTITVTAANDPPVAVGDAYTAVEDGTLSVLAGSGVLVNDTDPEAPPEVLTAVLNAGPVNGVLSCPTTLLPGICTDGSFQYVPNADYRGADSFTYHANDGSLNSNIVTVSLTVTPVNDVPSAVNDNRTTAEDTAVLISVLANDILGNDPALGDYPAVVSVETNPAYGTAVVAGTSIRYTPNADYRGSDSFVYRVTESPQAPEVQESRTATVSIAVTAVNDVPLAVDDNRTTAEDTPITVNVLTNDDLGNANLIGDQPVLVEIATGPTHGLAVVNADNTITYTPALNYNDTMGLETFTYTVKDAYDLAFVPPEVSDTSNVATVTIDVTPVNDAPVAVGDAYAVAEDASLNVPSAAYPNPAGVLWNDTDVDLPPQVLSAVLNVGPAHAASFSLNADGSFSYTPAADYRGADSFTYHANDGSLNSNVVTVTLDVTPVNDLPVAADDNATTAEDTAVLIPVVTNDSGLGDTPLVLTVVSGPTHGTAVAAGTSIRYTPDPNYNNTMGAESFQYTITDTAFALPEASDTSAPATVTVDVTPDNDPPVAVADSATTLEDTFVDVPVIAGASGIGEDTDVDNTNLELSVAPGSIASLRGGMATILPDGRTVRFTPTADANDGNTPGGLGFTYRASDGSATSLNPAAVTISVTAVNDAPVANPDSYTTGEDTPLVVPAPGVLGNDTDIDSPALTADWGSGPANGGLTLNTDGSFTYTPNLDFYGIDTFTYRAFDGSLYSAPAMATITINPVPPVLIVESTASQATVNVGETFTFTIIWANLGPDDAPGASLANSVSGPCTRISPAFPISLGTIVEGDGGFVDVTVRADGVGTCTSTATLTSTRSNPSPSSASVDIVEPSPFMGFVSGMLSFLGLSSDDPGTPTAMVTDPGLPASESPSPTLSDPTASPEPENTPVPGGTPTPAGSEVLPLDPPTPEPTVVPTEVPVPEPTPLVVSQGTLLADPTSPLGWVALVLSGVWLGRYLVFKVRVPAQRTGRGIRYHEPPTRPRRG